MGGPPLPKTPPAPPPTTSLDFLLTYIFQEVSRQKASARERKYTAIKYRHQIFILFFLIEMVEAVHFNWGRRDGEGVVEERRGGGICLPITAPSEGALWGQRAQQKEGFRTFVSTIWTLFIASRKALSAISLELRHERTRITYVSHITRTFFTGCGAHDALTMAVDVDKGREGRS